MPTTVPSTKPTPLFVAVGHQGQRMISANGTDWDHQQLGKEGEVYRAVGFGNGRYVAVGSYGGNNIFAGSADGITWQTSSKDAHYSTYLRGLGFGKGMLVALGGDPGAVGDSKPFIMTTTDGATWTDPYIVAGKNMIRRIAFGNDIFVGVGDRGRRCYCKEIKDWSDAPNTKAIDTLIDVAFGNGLFVGVGLNSLRMTTRDGKTWTDPIRGEEGEHLNTIIWAADRFVAIGIGVTYTSPDGRNWKRQENKDAPLTAAFGQGVFVGSNWKGRLLYSKDAVEWKQVFKSDYHFEAVAYGA